MVGSQLIGKMIKMFKLFRWAIVLGALVNIYIHWNTDAVYGWVVACIGWLVVIMKDDENGN